MAKTLTDKSGLKQLLRNTSCGQWLDLTHHILLWRSTFVGRCSKKTRWILRSTQSTYALAVRQPDLHCRRRKSGQLLGHTFSDALKHRGSTRQDNVGIQVFADIHIAFHDGLECPC